VSVNVNLSLSDGGLNEEFSSLYTSRSNLIMIPDLEEYKQM